MRILFTGSRHWNNAAPVAAIINSLPDHAIVIHGAARGLDSLAGSLAEQRGLTVEAHPADWSLHGRAAGPIRNAYIWSLTHEASTSPFSFMILGSHWVSLAA